MPATESSVVGRQSKSSVATVIVASHQSWLKVGTKFARNPPETADHGRASFHVADTAMLKPPEWWRFLRYA